MAGVHALHQLAFGIQSVPGAYAFLVGSGVSSAAGIMTGCQIALDLARRLAQAQGHDPDDFQAWYREQYGKDPGYSELLAALAPLPAERAALLRPYFEPSNEERAQGIKVPTAAHRALARLVTKGYVRMILTTNFDRLLEEALEDEGVAPQVLATVDSLGSSLPYVHTRCTVVKLHGDYRDTRLLNTAAELETYPPELREYLFSVLDDFGLVICGWSADSDVALRAVIAKRRSRQFSTYWLARGELKQPAESLVRKRAATVVDISDANQALSILADSVEALAKSLTGPIQVETIVSRAVEWLADPSSSVRLERLIADTSSASLHQLSAHRFPLDEPAVTQDTWLKRIESYEAAVTPLTSLLAAIAYYGHSDPQRRLTRPVERLAATMGRNEGRYPLEVYSKLTKYPALLAVYSSGVSAVAARRYGNLNESLLRPKVCPRPAYAKVPVIESVTAREVLFISAEYLGPDKRTPWSDFLLKRIEPVVGRYLFDSGEAGEIFDRFEYILGLSQVDLSLPRHDVTIGSFAWRRVDDGSQSPWRKLDELLSDSDVEELLGAGFFGGEKDRYSRAVEEIRKHISRARGTWP